MCVLAHSLPVNPTRKERLNPHHFNLNSVFNNLCFWGLSENRGGELEGDSWQQKAGLLQVGTQASRTVSSCAVRYSFVGSQPNSGLSHKCASNCYAFKGRCQQLRTTEHEEQHPTETKSAKDEQCTGSLQLDRVNRPCCSPDTAV